MARLRRAPGSSRRSSALVVALVVAVGATWGPLVGAAVAVSPPATPTFAKVATVNGTGPALGVATGDVDGDGKVDVVTADDTSDNVAVLYGDGAGGARAKATFSTGSGSHPHDVVLVDVNGDGKLDIATADTSTNGVSLLRNDGGTDASRFTLLGTVPATGAGPRAIVAADLNGDGVVDLATANFTANTVSILIGNGTGTFTATPAQGITVGSTPVDLVADDFNGDGRKDLAVTDFDDPGAITVLLGKAGGGWTTSTVAVANYPYGLAAGDLNGDGRRDLVVSRSGSDTVVPLLGNGSGGFTAGTAVDTGAGPFAAVVADLDGDGKADVATANSTAATVSVLLGDGTGKLTRTADDLDAGSDPAGLTAGLLDADGLPDLVVAGGGDLGADQTGSVSVLRSNTFSVAGPAAPVPEGGKATFTVKLRGGAHGATSVAYATSDGTGAGGDAAMAGSDYTAASGLLALASGATSGTVDVTTRTDTTAEPDESFSLTLSAPSGAALTDDATATATASIGDQGPLTVSVGPAQGNEASGKVVFSLVLSSASAVDVSVGYATGDLSAKAGADYTTTTGSATFAAGTTVVNITVPVAADDETEGDEQFSFALAAPTNATVDPAHASAIGTIHDGATSPTTSTAPPGAATVSVGAASVVEGTGGSTTLSLPITLSKAASGTVSVRATTDSGTATSGDDFTGTSRVIQIAAGQQAATFTVPVVPDALAERDETFTVTLTDPSGAGLGLAQATATIVDDDSLGTFTPVDPARILDTRTGLGRPAAGPLGPNQTIVVDVTGPGGVPSTGVAAVVLNVTATEPTASGYLSVTPAGGSSTSSVNFTPGRTVPNLVVAPVGEDGSVRVYNLAGTTHVLFDVVGWYATAARQPPASHYTSLPPARILDTRSAVGVATRTPLGQAQTLTAKVAGVGGVPATGAVAVVLNTTVTGTTASGFLSVTPNGGNSTSSLNFGVNQTIANLVVVPVGRDGSVRIFNNAGSSHVLFDVVGWFGAPGTVTAGTFRPLPPTRTLDTRTGLGRSDGRPAPVGATQTLRLAVAGAGGVPASGVRAVVANVTATDTTAVGYVSVTPAGGNDTSSLNHGVGDSTPNLVMMPVAPDGTIALYNSHGTSDLIVDVVGYIT